MIQNPLETYVNVSDLTSTIFQISCVHPYFFQIIP